MLLAYNSFQMLDFYMLAYILSMIIPWIVITFNEASAVNELVRCIHLIAATLSGKEVNDLNELSSKLLLTPELRDINGFDVFGFFTFRTRLLTSLVELLLTYFTVLIQFKL